MLIWVKSAGCSILVQVNLSDEYIPLWDQIKNLVKERTGALPQVALTRDESLLNQHTIFTNKPDEEYISVAREACSPLFEFTLKNFMKKRREFCYAGRLERCAGSSDGKLVKLFITGWGSYRTYFVILKSPSSSRLLAAIALIDTV